jgi:hypothetical protein
MRLFKPSFSKYQVIKISDILSDLGVVSMAAFVFPSFYSVFNYPKFLSGVFISFALFLTSIKIKK